MLEILEKKTTWFSLHESLFELLSDLLNKNVSWEDLKEYVDVYVRVCKSKIETDRQRPH